MDGWRGRRREVAALLPSSRARVAYPSPTASLKAVIVVVLEELLLHVHTCTHTHIVLL